MLLSVAGLAVAGVQAEAWRPHGRMGVGGGSRNAASHVWRGAGGWFNHGSG